nr:MAG TPA: hypothetical protein [Caudoviricetes sp.]
MFLFSDKPKLELGDHTTLIVPPRQHTNIATASQAGRSLPTNSICSFLPSVNANSRKIFWRKNVSKRFSVLFVVPLHCLGDRAVDEAVRAFSVRFGVCLNQIFFSLWNSNLDFIVCFRIVSVLDSA